MEKFLVETLEKSQERLDEILELQRVLDLLTKREPKIYSVSVTSNA